MRILVTGATGNVGSVIGRKLVETGADCRLFARDPQKAKQMTGASGEQIAVGDFLDHAAFENALDGVSAVYLVTNETADYFRALPGVLAAIEKARVERLVVLSATADIDSPSFFVRRHGEIDQAVNACNVPSTILHPDWFMQNYSYFRDGGDEIVFAAGPGKVSLVDVEDIADLAIECLTKAGHTGRLYRPTGPEALGFKQVAESLSRGLGRRITYTDPSIEEFVTYLMAHGLTEEHAQMRVGMTAVLRLGSISEPTNDIEFVLGRKPASFDDFARRLAA